jgi:transcription-repair coupling factor (superfamily II helicase)
LSSSSSLTVRALLKSAVARTGMGAPAERVSGLSASAKALWIAAAAARERTGGSPGPTLLVVVATDRDVEQLTGDARFFLSLLEGLPPAQSELAVVAFPSYETDPYRGLPPHLRVASARARALHAAATGVAGVIVASAQALLPRISAPARLLEASVDLRPGAEIEPQRLAEILADAGFAPEDPVDEHGGFCVRGGVVDLFPVGEPQPVRLELVGDLIESVRRYDPATQRSTASLDHILVEPLRDVFERAADGGIDRSSTLFAYVPHARLIVSEEDAVRAQAAKYIEQITASHADHAARADGVAPPSEIAIDTEALALLLVPATRLEELGVDDQDQAPGGPGALGAGGMPPTAGEAGADPVPALEALATLPRSPKLLIACQPVVEFRGRMAAWAEAIRAARQRGDSVVLVAATAGRAERVVEILRDYELLAVPVFSERASIESPLPSPEAMHAASVLIVVGGLSRGFRLPSAGLQIFAETDIFEEERRAAERRPPPTKTFLSDLRDLKVGDFVVHVDHGIGMFAGLKQLAVESLGEARQEFLELRYAADDKLFVPIERLDLIQKYSGATRPALDRLGGATWERAKTRVKKAMRDMAEELLKLYAARRAMKGHAFGPDTHWQEEFEGAFEYELTPDQRNAITDIKRDMESPMPMDRLLCGDVGYGKTEVAMRAAFKTVMDGKQVAFLAPTTVLTFQHLRTLKERFAAFPIAIDLVSRFRSKAEQKQALADLAAGRIDIIVGTHRLLSKDVLFKDLGLLVVDEEQRFGVAHKERLKQLRRKVDVLTMTATPIPRTLNMSLVGIRDMSIIETPPKDRLSIQTNVVRFDQQVIARAIRNEIARGGQIYFVHNRVESIYSIGNLVTRLVPEARLVIGHGQMAEEALERAMVDFIARKYDVLLATTIVENGLDIPNVNTIIINRADRYGLSQLYQLRGRVGRSDRPAYAYLLIPPGDGLSPVARKRLAAIREFSDLGSGFRVAALDLEIRGAGNLLGAEQSGHIEAVGFEMYVKLLEQTVRELKGEEIEEEVRATINLGVDLRIEEEYVPDMRQRLMLYRRVAAARDEQSLDLLLEEIRDRYGPLPASVLNLADYGRIRFMADQLGIESIDRQGPAVVFRFRVAPGPTSRPSVDPARLVRFLRGRPDVTLVPPSAMRLDLKARPGSLPPTGKGSRGTRLVERPAGGVPAGSWWTARALEGDIKPGFSKEAILKPAREDPRAPGGVFDRVGDLLSAMLEQR